MESVNIQELKNHLSYYLRQVRNGSELIIKDRNQIIARIVPALPETAPEINYEEELLELARQGKVRLPKIRIDEAFIDEMLNCELPRPKTKGKKAKAILRQIMDEERGKY